VDSPFIRENRDNKNGEYKYLRTMKRTVGWTFWKHECPETGGYPRFIPRGQKCPACEWAALSNTEKAKIRQSEYLNEIEGKD
jgi:hypothetical protein